MLKQIIKRCYGLIYRHSMTAIDVNPQKTQLKFFRQWAKEMSQTSVGRLQEKAIYTDLECFRHQVKITDYEYYQLVFLEGINRIATIGMIESGMNENNAGMFERQTTRYFGHSSTSKKYVPFTKKTIATFKKYQHAVLANLLHALPESNLKTFIVLGGLTIEYKGSAKLGYSSAIMMEHNTKAFRNMVNPPVAQLMQADFAEKLRLMEKRLIESAPDTLSGLPELVKGLILHLLKGPRAEEVRATLKKVKLLCWSGNYLTAEDEAFFRQTLSADLVISAVCSATEGAIGFGQESYDIFAPALQHNLFLFIDENADASASNTPRYFSWELEASRCYRLTMTNFSGLTAYLTGDIIEVVQQQPLRFKLRTPHNEYALLKTHINVSFTDFYLYFDGDTERLFVYLETAAKNSIVYAQIELLGKAFDARSVEFIRVEQGNIAQAAYYAAHHGLIKLKRYQDKLRPHQLFVNALMSLDAKKIINLNNQQTRPTKATRISLHEIT